MEQRVWAWVLVVMLLAPVIATAQSRPAARIQSFATADATPHVQALTTSIPCATSGPDIGAYSVHLCLAAPRNGTSMSGRVQVEATVTSDGAAPPLEYLQFFFTRSVPERSVSVLRDYQAPYTFVLPTTRWTDGAYRLEVVATFADDFTTPAVGLTLALDNDVSRIPVSTGGWEPYTPGPTKDDAITLAAVGDGAGGLPGSFAVAELIDGWNPDMFLYLGDVYNGGSYIEFLNYYEPTFGRFKAITNPVPGDHEGGKNFQGYLDYWNSSQYYYSVTVGSWHLIALNSTERYGQVTPGTLQFSWLQAQLEATGPDSCTLVFFHEPRWLISSQDHSDYLDDLWALLVQEGVDIVLNGHEHRYERWQALDETGAPDATGPVEFVVGTGGHELNPSRRIDPRVDMAYTADGAIRFALRNGAADYAFVTTTNEIIDSGTVTCGASAAGNSAP